MARKDPQSFTLRGTGSAGGVGCASSASTMTAPTKETAADFARRELEQIAQRMEVVSNRLSSAKKRLQDHFGIPVKDSTGVDQAVPRSSGMDGLRSYFDEIDACLHSIADGFEELI